MRKYVFGSLCLVLLFSLLSTAPPAEAGKDKKPKSIIQENFNTYINGSIVGQGGWIDRANGLPYVVQDVVKREGGKALYNNNTGADSVITKTGGTALANGREFFYIRTENRSGWGNYSFGENVQVRISKGSWDSTAYVVLSLKKDGHAGYVDNITDKWVDFDTYTDNAWTLVEIEWRTIDKSARFRVNNGVWTNWILMRGASSFTDFDTVGIATNYLGTGGVYIDDLH